MRNPSILQTDGKFDRDNIITKSDLEPTRPSIQQHLEAQTSSVNDSKIADSSLPSFLEKSQRMPSEMSKMELQPTQHGYLPNTFASHPYAEQKGLRYQQLRMGSKEARYFPDTTLTSSNHLARAYQPRAAKPSNSLAKHSEPPVIRGATVIVDGLASQATMLGSLAKDKDMRLLDSADAMTKDSLKVVPQSNKSQTFDRHAATAGAPIADDEDSMVKVGLTTGSRLGVDTADAQYAAEI